MATWTGVVGTLERLKQLGHKRPSASHKPRSLAAWPFVDLGSRHATCAMVNDLPRNLVMNPLWILDNDKDSDPIQRKGAVEVSGVATFCPLSPISGHHMAVS